ncbi:MAG TPA: hypothetical protein VE288_15380 [Rubrobacteraceae bacterium]|jgi:uncharacterized membrane-anchored protein|nr:hypothetical protein [Rubrobacteraceae bacterium]
MNKIPKVNTYFWIMKLAATTLGETGGDLVSMTLGLDYTGSAIIFFVLFLISLFAQLASRRLHPAIFWSVILTTTLTGTAVADKLARGTDEDRTLGLGYPLATAILLGILLAVLGIWYLSERSLAVERISSLRAETFYWVAILASNTLGTALGDFLADSERIGFLGANILITAILVLVLLATLFTNIPRVPLFWIAFVLTRPYGATFGDVLTKSPSEGGTGFGTVGASLIMAAILAIFIIYTTWNRDKVVEAEAVEPGAVEQETEEIKAR